MKITDLALVFILFTVPFLLLLEIKEENLNYVSYKQVELNRYFDTAIEDGASVIFDNGKINKNRAVDTFLKTLFMNFKISEGVYLKTNLTNYIPAIVIIENDGFEILSHSEFINSENMKEIKMIWNPKVFYSYSDNKYIYQFYIDDNLRVYEKATKKIYKGSYEFIINKIDITNSILENEDEYKVIKQREIVKLLQNDINYEINRHNDIIKNLGIDYQFTLPSISDDNWANSITDIGMMVFFQGMPIGSLGNRYSNFVLGGSKVLKGRKYYVVINSLNNKKKYYAEGSIVLENIKDDIKNNPETTIYKIEEYSSKHEAAKTGAFPFEIH
ncbi:hypothetical protein QUF55_02245 [Clostridiaceae bacterium HSG29]|nr:hypothetical protein [Clostridiaceae bacterium HSG29]